MLLCHVLQCCYDVILFNQLIQLPRLFHANLNFSDQNHDPVTINRVGPWILVALSKILWAPKHSQDIRYVTHTAPN